METSKLLDSKVSPVVRSFYVAVATQDQKLTTLLELLTALQLQAGQKLSTVVVCSSRDALDTVVCGLQDNPLFSVFALHSDLTDAERQFQVSRFQRQLGSQLDTTIQPHQDSSEAISSTTHASHDSISQSTRGSKTADFGSREKITSNSNEASLQPSLVLVTTDVCLKSLPREQPPLGASLLIQYELPSKKEQMMRRIGAVFGSGRERRSTRSNNIVINFVVAGEVPAFRAVEKFTQPSIISEVPVHVGDLFAV